MQIAAMAALHARVFTVPRPWTAEEIATLLATGHCFAETAPEGFAIARVVAGEAELLTIAVAPEARRKGVGRTLLDRIEATARTRHASRLFLEVASDNAPARALYAAAGLEQVGRRPRYYHLPDGSRQDALLLSKAL